MPSNPTHSRLLHFAKPGPLSKSAGISAILLSLVPLADAALILQTAYNPTASTWTAPALWDGTPMSAANQYQTVAGNPSDIGTSFTLNGKAWNYRGQVRDYPSASATTGNSLFTGGSLILAGDTRLLMKGRAGGTSTADISMLDDSHIQLAPDGNGGAAASSTLAGTLSIANNGVTGIGLTSNGGNHTFTISSTISGGVGSTLQLALGGNHVNRIAITGDYSDFAGTIYLGTVATGTGALGSTFAFAADSAPLATLHVTSNANFKFDLNTNVAFGNVILGTNTVLPVGTYTYSDLNTLGLAGSFVNNGGTLTVIPEPSAVGLAVLASAAFLRRRRL